MAIDSALKRRAVAGIALGPTSQTPDAVKGEAWRYIVGWAYPFAGGAPAPTALRRYRGMLANTNRGMNR